ncbi:MAG: hypothetical protein OCD02_06500 [Spirochaetaceae bacterium]
MKYSIDDLENELIDYRKQKEKVEKIVNLIGGKKGFKRMIVIDTILILSLVVIFLLDLAHKKNQSEHFMFWLIPL